MQPQKAVQNGASLPGLDTGSLKKRPLTQTKKILASGILKQTQSSVPNRATVSALRCFTASTSAAFTLLCLRMTGNTAEAEDLTQEAFLQLYRKIATFRGESAFSTWLHRLAVNVVLMHLRKKGLPEVSLQESLEPQEEDGPKKDIGARDNVLAGSI